jgi:hypothetical protein
MNTLESLYEHHHDANHYHALSRTEELVRDIVSGTEREIEQLVSAIFPTVLDAIASFLASRDALPEGTRNV